MTKNFERFANVIIEGNALEHASAGGFADASSVLARAVGFAATAATPVPVRVTERIELSQVRIAFDVSKSFDSNPNKASVYLYNLSKSTRERIQAAAASYRPTLTLDIGYGGLAGSEVVGGVLFKGTITRAYSQKMRPDIITTISCGDGAHAFERSSVSSSFGRIDVDRVIKTIADSFKQNGVKIAAEFEATLRDQVLNPTTRRGQESADGSPWDGIYERGLALVGKSIEKMDEVAEKIGADWSIQNEQLYVVRKGQLISNDAIVIDSDHGLVGSPEPTEGGGVRFVHLNDVRFVPGSGVIVQSSEYNGDVFRIERASFRGDTHGAAWECEIEGSPTQATASGSSSESLLNRAAAAMGL